MRAISLPILSIPSPKALVWTTTPSRRLFRPVSTTCTILGPSRSCFPIPRSRKSWSTPRTTSGSSELVCCRRPRWHSRMTNMSSSSSTESRQPTAGAATRRNRCATASSTVPAPSSTARAWRRRPRASPSTTTSSISESFDPTPWNPRTSWRWAPSTSVCWSSWRRSSSAA